MMGLQEYTHFPKCHPPTSGIQRYPQTISRWSGRIRLPLNFPTTVTEDQPSPTRNATSRVRSSLARNVGRAGHPSLSEETLVLVREPRAIGAGYGTIAYKLGIVRRSVARIVAHEKTSQNPPEGDGRV